MNQNLKDLILSENKEDNILGIEILKRQNLFYRVFWKWTIEKIVSRIYNKNSHLFLTLVSNYQSIERKFNFNPWTITIAKILEM